jgi:epoxyqueuosine reductase
MTVTRNVTHDDERCGGGRRRIGRDRMARNAAVALGNSADPAVLPELRALATAELQPMVREHLLWAIDRLERSQEQVNP